MASRFSARGFSAESIKVIRKLESYGWTFEMSNSNHAFGKAPDGETTGSVPRKLSRANRSQQNADALVTRWERFLEAAEEVEAATRAKDAFIASEEDDVLDDVILRGAAKHATRAMDALDATIPPTVVLRTPWLARQGTSRKDATADLYESHAVVQVTWSDGSTSFECAKPGCDYVSVDNPRSVASHYRAHVRKGDAEHVPAERPSVVKATPIDPESIRDRKGGTHESSYTPTERLVRALAYSMEQAGTTDVTALAYAALVWAHERPDLPEVEPRGPMTESEILNKIRLLVGGRDPEMEEALREALVTVERLTQEQHGFQEVIAEGVRRVEELTASAAAWEAEAAREKARADRLQSDIDAWLSLAPRPPA